MKPLRMKVLKAVKPDKNSISASRQINLRQGRPRTERSSGDHEPTLEDQDAKPGEESDQVDGNRDSFQQQLMNHGWPS